MKRVLVLAAMAALMASPASARNITECDQLATHGSDPDRITVGVSQSAMDKPAAIEACRKDVAADPDNPRLIYQLGRAMFYSGMFAEGLPLVKQAADLGHAQSQFVYGYVKAYGQDGQPADACEAETYWELSAEQGRRAAQISYPRMYMMGAFEDCGDTVDLATQTKWMEDVKDKMTGYYEGLLYEDVMADFTAFVESKG